MRPNGKKWQARVYKPAKKGWDPVDTFDTRLEAARPYWNSKKGTEMLCGITMGFPSGSNGSRGCI